MESRLETCRICFPIACAIVNSTATWNNLTSPLQNLDQMDTGRTIKAYKLKY